MVLGKENPLVPPVRLYPDCVDSTQKQHNRATKFNAANAADIVFGLKKISIIGQNSCARYPSWLIILCTFYLLLVCSGLCRTAPFSLFSPFFGYCIALRQSETPTRLTGRIIWQYPTFCLCSTSLATNLSWYASNTVTCLEHVEHGSSRDCRLWPWRQPAQASYD